MKRRRKEGQGRQELGIPVIDCPRCGCPNRPTDTKCAYCETPLDRPVKKSGGERFSSWFNTLKFRLGLAADRQNLASAAGKGGTALISALLLGGGLYLFYSGISGGGALPLFSGILLTLYGGAGIFNSLKK